MIVYHREDFEQILGDPETGSGNVIPQTNAHLNQSISMICSMMHSGGLLMVLGSAE
jgi:hypothetical protein